MFRILVVDDQTDFYEEYLLRIFANLLPMDKISMAHAPTLDAALAVLQEPWHVILMDYSLGAQTDFLGTPVRDGSDLVAFRRAVEQQKQQPEAYIIGISSNEVGNRLIRYRGAHKSCLKIAVEEMAQSIQERLGIEKEVL